MAEAAATTINSSLCYDPLVNLLCTETEGDLQFAAGYALGFDLFRDSKDVLEALFEICASRGLAERLLLSLMKYYVAKLQDINLLLRDNDCITYLWKLYLNHQTSFLIDTALRKTLNQLARLKDPITMEHAIPYSIDLLSQLSSAIEEFPTELRVLLLRTHQIISARFPDESDKTLMSLVVTSTYILRVLCPQIVCYEPRSTSRFFPFTPAKPQDAQQRLVTLAKLLQLVANNPEDVEKQHQPEVAAHVRAAQKEFLGFCVKLFKVPDFMETPLTIECSEETLAISADVLYSYAKENTTDILHSLQELHLSYDKRHKTSDDRMYEMFVDESIFKGVDEHLTKPNREDMTYSPGTCALESLFKESIEKVCDSAQAMKCLQVKSKSDSDLSQSIAQLTRVTRSASLMNLKTPDVPIQMHVKPTGCSSSLDWFHQEAKFHSYTILVFYRGFWCPFCKTYLDTWKDFVPLISASGGAVFAISSESKKKRILFEKRLQYLKFLKDRDFSIADHYKVDSTHQPGKTKRLTQPAIICLNNEGRLLYFWSSTANLGNLMGARDRIPPRVVLQSVLRSQSQRSHKSQPKLNE